MDKLTIVITTCDKFSDLWLNQIFLLDKYWKQHPIVYLVSDKDNRLADGLNVVFRYFEEEYTTRLRLLLSQVDSEYVFLTLDDYLICDYVDVDRIQEIVRIMDESNLSYVRFYDQTKTKGWFDKEKRIHALPLTSLAYEVNLYPSIWRKTDLLQMLYREENIWKFEVRLTRRCREKGFVCGWVNYKKTFNFVDTIRKGKYLPKAYRFLEKNNLYISDRPVRTKKETFALAVRTFVGRYFPNSIKRIIKKIRKGSYYSDYANNDD